jgi:hypothetical protein
LLNAVSDRYMEGQEVKNITSGPYFVTRTPLSRRTLLKGAGIGRGGRRVALDLAEVNLVDLEGVRFLNACEA